MLERTIVVVDDDADIRELLTDYLQDNGFNVLAAEDAKSLNILLENHKVDLIVLDIMLPGEDGYSICRRLVVQANIPILMLTANADDISRIIGLEIGADDYMSKPFNPRELLARIKAILRRTDLEQTPQVQSKNHQVSYFGPWHLDHESRELINSNGDVQSLTSSDFNLLLIFVSKANQELSRDELYDKSRGKEHSPFDRSLDVHISRLRQRLEDDAKKPQLIKTVRGIGYIFATHVETVFK